MKSKFILVTKLFLLISYYSVQAQNNHIDIEARANISGVWNYGPAPYISGFYANESYKVGYNVSVVREFDIKNDWFFATGIGYSLRRFQDETQWYVVRYYTPLHFVDSSHYIVNVANSFHFLELPLLLKCYATKEFTVEFGFIPTYILATNYKDESGTGLITGINKFGLDGKLSLGYFIFNKMAIDFSAQLALTNLYNGKSGSTGYGSDYISGQFYVFSFGVIYQIK